jgi:hypothetical protein
MGEAGGGVDGSKAASSGARRRGRLRGLKEGRKGTHTTNYSPAKGLRQGGRGSGPATWACVAKWGWGGREGEVLEGSVGARDGRYGSLAGRGRARTMGDGCGCRRIGLDDGVQSVEGVVAAPRSAVVCRAVRTS